MYVRRALLYVRRALLCVYRALLYVNRVLFRVYRVDWRSLLGKCHAFKIRAGKLKIVLHGGRALFNVYWALFSVYLCQNGALLRERARENMTCVYEYGL